MNILAAIAMLLVLFAAWLAQLVGLPGNWLIVIAAAGYAWWIPPDAAITIGRNTVIVLVVLAALGEVVELVASAAGVTRSGGSRRAAVLAMIGSVIGGFVGMFVGVPIPLVGSLVAAVLFAGLGALIGAWLGERWLGRDFDASLEIGRAAFVARLMGTAAKMIVSSMMVAVTLAALIF